jgi:group I intron endonuclease
MPNENYRILSGPIPCLEVKKMPNVVISGVYKIENVINHKVYIGQSKNVVSRFKRGHLLLHNVGNPYLKSAFQKYGYENFTAEVIKETYDLDYWEIFLIQIYHARDRKYGYNMCIGGEGGCPFLGKHHTEETKRKKSEAMKRFYSTKVWTDEERDKLRYWKGKHHTEEQKRKMSESCKGINRGPKSEEHRRKIAETLKGNIPGNKGMKMSQEFCRKQVEIKRALYNSPKGKITKQKLREANLDLCYWNDGKIEIHSKEAPAGFSRGKLGSVYKRKYWYTNGLTDVYVGICPKGFKYGRTFPNVKGTRWNDGKINLWAVNCPGEGFVKGQLNKPKV